MKQETKIILIAMAIIIVAVGMVVNYSKQNVNPTESKEIYFAASIEKIIKNPFSPSGIYITPQGKFFVRNELYEKE